MFGLQEISIDFLTAHAVWVVLGALVALTLAIWLYRRTNPPLTTIQRTSLVTLRVIAILCLFLALLEPILNLIHQDERRRRVAVLIDQSGSMEREEDGRTRRARMDSLLSSRSFETLRSSADVGLQYFGGNLAAAQDEVDAERTALGDVLHERRRQELTDPTDYWLLFSDGRSNSGRAVGALGGAAGPPIIAVNVAGDRGNLDASVTATDFNPVVFAGQQAEVKITLAFESLVDQDLNVQLRDSSRVLASEVLRPSQATGMAEATLSFVPEKPGQLILSAGVGELEGEEILSNNRRSFAVKVLKSRLAVLLVTAQPDYEIGFLHRFLRRSEKYDVELAVTGDDAGALSGQLPSRQTELNRYDLVVLHDPSPADVAPRRQVLETYLTDRGGSLLVLMGRRFAAEATPEWLLTLLPISVQDSRSYRPVEFHAVPAEGHLFHPALRLADDQASIRAAWSEVPPFRSLVRCRRVDPDGVVLAYASGTADPTGRLPVLAYRRVGPGKVLASAGLPFWTWRFAQLGYGDDGSRYDAFVEGALSWLTVDDDLDPLRIQPDRDVFSRGEPVGFAGYAYDLGFRPLEQVTGRVRLTADDGEASIEADLVGVGDGVYRASLDNLSSGKYTWTGQLAKDGSLLKEASGSILVEEFSLEEFDQRGDPATLAALANGSGGEYFKHDRFDDAVASIATEPVVELTQQDIVLWSRSWLLVIMVAALSLEWLIRKRLQML